VRRFGELNRILVASRTNVIWSGEFKGKFCPSDKQYGYPLTVMGIYSLYVLAIVGMHKPAHEGIKAILDAFYWEFWLSDQIRADNREPLCGAQSLAKLIRLDI